MRSVGVYWGALPLLLAFQVVNNWLWVTTGVTILGWDRPSHLLKMRIYYDLFERIDARTIFTAMTWQQNRPPLPFLAGALFYRLFGVSTDVALMSNTIFVIILTLATYGLGHRIYNKGVGLLAAFFVSLFPILFNLSRTSYPDYALTAMVALSIYLLVCSDGFRNRRFSSLFGLSVGLGMLTKWPFIAFAGGPIAFVIFNSGAIRDLGRGLPGAKVSSAVGRWLASPLIHFMVALLLTLAWYLPNRDRVPQLLLGRWLFVLSLFLLTSTFFLLTRRPGQGVNLLSALALGVTVASIWSLPNIGFLRRFLFTAYSGVNLKGGRLDFLDISTYTRYLEAMIREQLSPLFFTAFLIALLILALSRARNFSLKRMKGEAWVLLLWLVVPYLIFTFSRTMNPRFDVALLPPVAIITAHGLLRLRSFGLRVAFISFFALGGLVQYFVLSYDALAWVGEKAILQVPGVGRLNLLAQGVHIQRPSSGVRDPGYWVAPQILDFVDQDREGKPTILGLLAREIQLNESTFHYLMYGGYQGVELWEINQIKDNLPVYPRLFACDYLVMKGGPNPRVSAETQRVVQKVLHDQGDYFHQVFRVARRYELPSGEIVYLYRKEARLALGYDLEAYQALMRELESEEREGDAIVLDSPSQIEIFGRYYEGGATFYPLLSSQPFDEGEVAEELEEIVARHHRIYAIFWGQGGSSPYVEEWLKKNAYPALEAWYGGVRLLLYGASTEAGREPLDAEFGEEILLTGYYLAREEVERGDILLLTLFWEAEREVSTDYKVFVHLLDEDGSILAQHDSQPMGGVRPTSGWRIGEKIEDRHGVLLPEIPPGEYSLVVGVYDPESGERLSISDGGERAMGDSLLLGRVRVVSQ